MNTAACPPGSTTSLDGDSGDSTAASVWVAVGAAVALVLAVAAVFVRRRRRPQS